MSEAEPPPAPYASSPSDALRGERAPGEPTSGERAPGEPVTPVGKRPATGGRVRLYENGAERARAWRERQRARQDAAEESQMPPSPELAEASLGIVLEQLPRLAQSHLEAMGALVAKIEDAIGALADPDAVAQSLAAARAEAARQVAEATETLAKERQLRVTAQHAAREEAEARTEADAAANAAFEQVEALHGRLEEARREISELQEAVNAGEAAHASAQKALEDAHSVECERLRAEADKAVAQAVRAGEAALAEAQVSMARAEATAEAAQKQLAVQQASHERAWSELRASHAQALEAARAEVTEVLTARHGAELEGLRARGETAIARAEAQLTGAGELAQAQRAEITRLVAQVEDLRSELARARGEEQVPTVPRSQPTRGRGAQAPQTLVTITDLSPDSITETPHP